MLANRLCGSLGLPKNPWNIPGAFYYLTRLVGTGVSECGSEDVLGCVTGTSVLAPDSSATTPSVSAFSETTSGKNSASTSG